MIEVQHFRDNDADLTIRAVVDGNQIFVSPYPFAIIPHANLAKRCQNFKLIVVRDWEDDYQDFPTAEIFLTPEDFLKFVSDYEDPAKVKYTILFFLEQVLPKLTKQIENKKRSRRVIDS